MSKLLLFLIASILLVAQANAPSLDPAYASDTFVTGTAAVGSGPITVYDISYPAKARLGSGEVDNNGRFAISIDPPLKQGNSIVVENKAKVAGAPVTVQPPRPRPTP